MKISRNILFNPGPCTTSDSVKQALLSPDICPRESEFAQLVKQLNDGLVDLIEGHDTHACVPLAGSGTAAIEAVLGSAVPKGGRAAVLVNGAYGQRMVEILMTLGIETEVVHEDWEKHLDIENVIQQLDALEKIDVLCWVHHETTTGQLNPIKPFLELCHKKGWLSFLDAMSSFAGIPMSLKDTPLDFIVSSVNKCLHGLPGLSFVIASKVWLEESTTSPRSYYLDIKAQYKSINDHDQCRFTPPVQVIYAANQALLELKKIGVEARYKHYKSLMSCLKAGLGQLGFSFLLPASCESQILTTVLEPDGQVESFKILHDLCYAEGFTIYPGKLMTSKRCFRLSVLGDLCLEDVDAFLNLITPHIKEIYSSS